MFAQSYDTILLSTQLKEMWKSVCVRNPWMNREILSPNLLFFSIKFQDRLSQWLTSISTPENKPTVPGQPENEWNCMLSVLFCSANTSMDHQCVRMCLRFCSGTVQYFNLLLFKFNVAIMKKCLVSYCPMQYFDLQLFTFNMAFVKHCLVFYCWMAIVLSSFLLQHNLLAYYLFLNRPMENC